MTINKNASKGHALPRFNLLVTILLATAAGCDDGAESDPAVSDLNSTQVERDESVLDPSGDSRNNSQYSLVESATADVGPTSLGSAEGTVSFSPAEQGAGVRVSIDVRGLQPGLHGFHIHAVGDCSADDASSAGGHFNPYNVPHGAPEDTRHHVGDMGNIDVGESGRVNTTKTFQGLAFSGPASILQKAVVIHSVRDDLESQPSGAAGDRVGCGVIRIDKDVLAQ